MLRIERQPPLPLSALDGEGSCAQSADFLFYFWGRSDERSALGMIDFLLVIRNDEIRIRITIGAGMV